MYTIEPKRVELSYSQSEVLRESLEKTFLLIWKYEITDLINIANQFLTFSELPRHIQGFCLCGGGITSVPLDFEVPSEYFYHCKILEAIRNDKVSLIAYTDEEIN